MAKLENTWETRFWKMMFPRFFKAFSKDYQALTDKTSTQINLFSMGWLTEINNICNRRKNVFHRPLSQGGHFESQENKKFCFCPSSLTLDERLDGQNLLFQHYVIKLNLIEFSAKSENPVTSSNVDINFNKISELLSLCCIHV